MSPGLIRGLELGPSKGGNVKFDTAEFKLDSSAESTLPGGNAIFGGREARCREPPLLLAELGVNILSCVCNVCSSKKRDACLESSFDAEGTYDVEE